MLTSSDYDAVTPVSSSNKLRLLNTERESRTAVAASPKYDSVTLSSQTEESRFRKELVSRLSGEVRTATSTGDIQRLRQAVAEGSYTPDPMVIAGRILYLDEEE
jgi:negative regulator of flagellin synthesis FlgM